LKLLSTFVSELDKLGVDVDLSLAERLYNRLNPRIQKNAKTILFPIAVAYGVVYAMDNRTGKPVEFTFSRASSATMFDSNKNLQLVNNDIPRIDYGNYTDSMKLLIERERTNYLLKSDFRLSNSDGYAWIVSLYNNHMFDTDHSVYTIINGTSASRIQRSLDLNEGTHNISIYGDNHNHAISFGNFINASVGVSDSVGYDGYKIHNCNFNVIAGGATVTIRPYMPVNQGWLNGEQLFVKYIQIESGIDQTSYIPTNDTAATRAADLLTYALSTASQVYIKTTKQETTLNKPSGVWNVHEDLNNEGIEVLAVL